MKMPVGDVSTGRFLMRTHHRFSVCFPVSYRGRSFLGHGTVENISARGWKIKGVSPGEMGTQISLHIHCIGHEPPVHIRSARVQWVRARAFGVAIEEGDPFELMRLKECIGRLVRTL